MGEVMKEKTLKNVLYILLIVGLVLLVSHLEYQELQDDRQAQVDCRAKDDVIDYQ